MSYFGWSYYKEGGSVHYVIAEGFMRMEMDLESDLIGYFIGLSV